MRGRQVLMQTLVNHGVDRIFGNPGTTESPIIDSLDGVCEGCHLDYWYPDQKALVEKIIRENK